MSVKNGRAKDDDDEREAALEAHVLFVLFDVEGPLSPSAPILYPPIPVPLTQYLFLTSGASKRSASLSENVRSMHFIRSPPPVNPPRLMVSLANTFPTKGVDREGGRKQHTEYKAAPVLVNCII